MTAASIPVVFAYELSGAYWGCDLARQALRASSMTAARQHVSAAFRYAWALPATLVGLLFSILALCAGARIGFFGGAMEVACTRLGRVICLLPPSVRFVAITFGHVIIGTDEAVLRQARSHEHVHVRQYERWGILFFPLYAGSSLVQFVRGRDPYLDNRFEREACAAVTKSQQA